RMSNDYHAFHSEPLTLLQSTVPPLRPLQMADPDGAMGHTIVGADSEQTIRAVVNGFGGGAMTKWPPIRGSRRKRSSQRSVLSKGRPTARVNAWSGGMPSAVK